MKTQKKRRNAILMVLLFLTMLFQTLNVKVKAEEADSTVPTFTEVKRETIGFALQHKGKTIIKNVNIVDNNLKLFVEEKDQKHIISEDFNFLRWLDDIGVYNDNLYVIQDTEENKPIYKVDLNTYKMEFVKNMPTSPVGNPSVSKIVIDQTGIMWFLGAEYNIPEYYPNSTRIKDNYTRHIVYNEKGFKFEFSILQQSGRSNFDTFSGLQVDPDGNVWFFKSFGTGTDNKLYRVSKDNQIKEFTIPTSYTIRSIYVGRNNTINIVDGPTTRTDGSEGFDKEFVQRYTIVGDNLQLMKEFDMTGKYVYYDKDINGNLWVDEEGGISKFEGDNLVKKYIVSDVLEGIRVYDDKHLVATGVTGFNYFNISIDDEKPPVVDDTKPPVVDDGKSPVVDDAKPPVVEKFTTKIDSNTKSAAVVLDTAQIVKNGVNEVAPLLGADVQSVEAKLDAAAINGGTGSIKLYTSKVTMELPFAAVDYEGTVQGSYVNIKQNIITNDPILKSLKHVGKLFDFSLVTYMQDGTKIKDIHNFKSGKAKIAVKLTSDEVKNFDTTKLGAYYYNEKTRQWELIGGSFDKNTMTFTFETTHFSKYTIAQTNGMLPQTGAFLNNNDLIIGALLLIALGLLLFIKKPAVK